MKVNRSLAKSGDFARRTRWPQSTFQAFRGILPRAMKKRALKKLAFGPVLAAGLLTVVGGCTTGNKLETGYTYRPLSASQAEIRGFYAERFTPEARAAQLEREQEFEARRPKPGY